ncbi:MAG: DUF4845 domain-containing protein [Methylococcales bacterium]|nr:DUF4845 domain-containing protein [Methylococcales bacterium]
MQQFAKKQHGMTMIGWVTVLLLIAFFVTLLLRLVPIYMENSQIKTIMDSFDEEAGLSQMSKADVKKKIGNKLYINAIKTVSVFDKVKKPFTITKKENELTIDLEYEVRTPLFFNIDAVVSFKEQYKAVFH